MRYLVDKIKESADKEYFTQIKITLTKSSQGGLTRTESKLATSIEKINLKPNDFFLKQFSLGTWRDAPEMQLKSWNGPHLWKDTHLPFVRRRSRRQASKDDLQWQAGSYAKIKTVPVC